LLGDKSLRLSCKQAAMPRDRSSLSCFAFFSRTLGQELGQRLPHELGALALLTTAVREAIERYDRRFVY